MSRKFLVCNEVVKSIKKLKVVSDMKKNNRRAYYSFLDFLDKILDYKVNYKEIKDFNTFVKDYKKYLLISLKIDDTTTYYITIRKIKVDNKKTYDYNVFVKYANLALSKDIKDNLRFVKSYLNSNGLNELKKIQKQIKKFEKELN